MLSTRRLISNIFAANAESNQVWAREHAAAVKIQSTVRMHQQRKRFTAVRNCAIRIQRNFRGYRGRLRVLDLRIDQARHRQAMIFYCAARNIQRVFRGFYCRKYTNDFCAQKAYIARIQQTSESVRQAARRAQQEQEEFLAAEQAKQLRRDFEAAVRDKHHLLSTAVSAGVLRTPLAPNGTQTVFGTDIEEEIRSIPIERPKRSKFLKDVIPIQQQHAATSRAGGSNRQAAAAASSAGSGSQEKGKARLHFGKGGEQLISGPYQRSLQSESEYDRSDKRTLDRVVEEKIVQQLHGPRGGHFAVHRNVNRGPPVATGYSGSFRK